MERNNPDKSWSEFKDINNWSDVNQKYNLNRICYLILQIHVPSNTMPPPSRRELLGIRSAKKAGGKLGIIITPIRLVLNRDNLSYGDYRYAFRFPRYKPND